MKKDGSQNIFKARLTQNLGAHSGFNLSEMQLDLLEAHFSLLIKWNKVHNLTAVEDLDSLVSEHYVDCIVGTSLIWPLEEDLPWHDLGSGNGFPGLVAGVLFSERRFRLVETSRKKCSFLRIAVSELGLKNVEVIQGRVEDLRDIDRALTRAAFSESNIANLSRFFKCEGKLALMTVPGFPSPNWNPENNPWTIESRASYALSSGADRSVVVLKKRDVPRET